MAFKQLMADYDQISRTFANLAQLTYKMHNLHDQFNKSVEFGKTTVNQNIYGSMTQTFQALQKSFAKSVLSVRETMLKNVKYTQHEITALNEVANKITL
jgi:cytochrome c556